MTILGTNPKERTPLLPDPLYLGLQDSDDAVNSSITNAAGNKHLQSHATPREIDPELLNPSPLPMSGGFPLQSTLNSNQSMTPAPPAKLRVRWTDIMEQVLLAALRVIVLRGKSFDCFKRAHWVEAAGKVKQVYEGPADLDWKRAKSKFEDKYRPLWRKWKDHCAGLSPDGLKMRKGCLRIAKR